MNARKAGLALCLAVLALLTAQVLLQGPLLALDVDASRYFATHRNAALATFMLGVSALHQSGVLLAVAAVVAMWLVWRGDRYAARALLVVPTGMVLNNFVFKDVIRRPRPAWPDPLVQLATWSFPSGHAAASTVFYGILCALVFARTRSRVARTLAIVVAVVMVLLVSFSRVYLGAHYPTDVAAGIALGGACVAVFAGTMRAP